MAYNNENNILAYRTSFDVKYLLNSRVCVRSFQSLYKYENYEEKFSKTAIDKHQNIISWCYNHMVSFPNFFVKYLHFNEDYGDI